MSASPNKLKSVPKACEEIFKARPEDPDAVGAWIEASTARLKSLPDEARDESCIYLLAMGRKLLKGGHDEVAMALILMIVRVATSAPVLDSASRILAEARKKAEPKQPTLGGMQRPTAGGVGVGPRKKR